MKPILLALFLASCGGMGLHAPEPDSGPTIIDAGVDSEPTGDAWWTANLGQGLCGDGYTQKLYAPNEFTWCEGSPDAGGIPCGELTIVGWYRAGLYKCAKV